MYLNIQYIISLSSETKLNLNNWYYILNLEGKLDFVICFDMETAYFKYCTSSLLVSSIIL